MTPYDMPAHRLRRPLAVAAAALLALGGLAACDDAEVERDDTVTTTPVPERVEPAPANPQPAPPAD